VDDSGGFPSAQLTTSSSRVVHRGWSANLGGSPSRSADQPTRKPLARLGRGQTPRSGRSAQCSARAVGVIALDFASPRSSAVGPGVLGLSHSPLSAADWGDGLTEAVRRERPRRLVAVYGIDAHPGGHRRAPSAPARCSLLRWPHRTAAAHARVERSRQALSAQRGAPTDDLCRLPLIGRSGGLLRADRRRKDAAQNHAQRGTSGPTPTSTGGASPAWACVAVFVASPVPIWHERRRRCQPLGDSGRCRRSSSPQWCRPIS
jgi:hypothetical protein